MIVKESITEDSIEPYEEQGDQRKMLRSKDWYKDIFMKYGFKVLLTDMHTRRRDGSRGYNDEMLFCLEPIIFSFAENQLRYGIKADAVRIDGETKRFCTECFDKQRPKRHD